VIEKAEKPETIHNFRAWAKEVVRWQAFRQQAGIQRRPR
jgi:hypothetical protein